MLLRRVQRRTEDTVVSAIVDSETVLAMQAGVEAIDVDPDIARYCVDLAAATRADAAVEVGASPRGSQSLLLVARALAAIEGRDYVVTDDVKNIAVSALAHRITLTPQAWSSGVQAPAVVEALLDQVAGPAVVAADR